RGWRQRAGQAWVAWDAWVRSPRHLLALAMLLGSVVFYLLAADHLGFLITSSLLLTALFLVLRVPPWRALPIAVVATLVVHFAFYQLLRVPLPWGLLQGVAW
ncbi:MAG TPA: tripartite tricarboxylate transporter TctB family protein, partial [Ramlibacter sp.]|nr:tripartite tricarboxylate transporter TctB family protein [Ramlibacter sp.]